MNRQLPDNCLSHASTTEGDDNLVWPSQPFRADWTFSLGPDALSWPQSFSGYPAMAMATDAPTISQENTSFEDISTWEEWDNSEHQNAADDATSEMPCDESSFFPGAGQLPVETVPCLTTPPLFATLSPIVSPSMSQGPVLKFSQEPQADVALNSSFRSLSTTVPKQPQVSSLVEKSTGKTSPTRPKTATSSRNTPRKSNARRSITSPRISSQSHPTRYRTTSATLPVNSYPTPASTDRSANSPPPASTTSRGLTEQKYRARVNDQFTALLDSIPKELVKGSGESAGGAYPDKPVSKIEVLDLAQMHINSLERQQAELKEEGAVLKGQVEVYKQLFVGMGGQLMP